MEQKAPGYQIYWKQFNKSTFENVNRTAVFVWRVTNNAYFYLYHAEIKCTFQPAGHQSVPSRVTQLLFSGWFYGEVKKRILMRRSINGRHTSIRPGRGEWRKPESSGPGGRETSGAGTMTDQPLRRWAVNIPALAFKFCAMFCVLSQVYCLVINWNDLAIRRLHCVLSAAPIPPWIARCSSVALTVKI